jgi:predicted ATP-grasp superfamily ATP-dependent carboligase
MTMLPPAIVLGIDTPIGLTVVRELGARGVPVHGVGRNPDAIGRASRYCTSFSVRPPDRLEKWLPDLIIKTKARALLAISEADLVALSALDPIIRGCAILTPRAAPLSIVLDKRKTLENARDIGIDTPKSWQPVIGDDFATRASACTYPAIAKWADPTAIARDLEALGFPMVKAEYVHDKDQLIALINNYAPLGTWPVIQSYCPGFGLGHMLYMKDGNATLRFQHRRLHEWPPEGGTSTLCTSLPLDTHQDQMARSEQLLRRIGWEGPAMVEYRFDPATGRYWLMEINGRFWGSQPLASHCGAKFAWEAYRLGVLGEVDTVNTPIKHRRARYMIPETKRLIRVWRDQRAIADPHFKAKPVTGLLRYITGFFDPKMRYFLFDWRDPMPFWADFSAVIKKAARRRKR